MPTKINYNNIEGLMRMALVDTRLFKGVRDQMFSAIKTGVVDQNNASRLIALIDLKSEYGFFLTQKDEEDFRTVANGFMEVLKPVALQNNIENQDPRDSRYYGSGSYSKSAFVLVSLRNIEQALRTKAEKLLKKPHQHQVLLNAASAVKAAYGKITMASRSGADLKAAIDDSFKAINRSDVAQIINTQRKFLKTKVTKTRGVIDKAVEHLTGLTYLAGRVSVEMPSIGREYQGFRDLKPTSGSKSATPFRSVAAVAASPQKPEVGVEMELKTL